MLQVLLNRGHPRIFSPLASPLSLLPSPSSQMPGLYLHIPFCARRCPYCDFAVHIGGGSDFQSQYLQALHREVASTCSAFVQRFPDEEITTIFCGGGTPTAIGARALNELLQLVRNCALVATDAEITLEGNPEDPNSETLCELQNGGWNRLSLGVQSLDDAVLQTLGRRHRRARVEEVVAALHEVGWNNWSLDLIYAVPNQSLASWHETLKQATEFSPAHISCYSLTIEEGTAFARRVRNGRLQVVEDDVQAQFMESAHSVLESAGYERYEVSNYARRGSECRHNLEIWRGGNYLACGNGAHGHRDGHRWWNERDTAIYIERLQNSENADGAARAGEEWLEARQRLDELVLMGLRLNEGFSIPEVSQRCGLEVYQEIGAHLDGLIERGVLESLAVENDGLENVSFGANLGGEMTRVRMRRAWLAMADAVALEVLS